MGRCSAGSQMRGRLEQAAQQLYSERGFEQTTVAEIARLAGLTERRFFRHFADKREVLFWGAGALQELVVTSVASAPDAAGPIDAVAAAAVQGGAGGPGHHRVSAAHRAGRHRAHPWLCQRQRPENASPTPP